MWTESVFAIEWFALSVLLFLAAALFFVIYNKNKGDRT